MGLSASDGVFDLLPGGQSRCVRRRPYRGAAGEAGLHSLGFESLPYLADQLLGAGERLIDGFYRIATDELFRDSRVGVGYGSPVAVNRPAQAFFQFLLPACGFGGRLLQFLNAAVLLGNSLLPLMNGEESKEDDPAAISETDTVIRIHSATAGIKLQLDPAHRRISLRTGKWKYLYTEGGGDELYDLEDDPKETKNLIDIETVTAAELRAKILVHIQLEEKSACVDKELLKTKI